MLCTTLQNLEALYFDKSDTVQLLEQAMPAFISQDLWPPNSPDVNPVDYKIWAIISQQLTGAQH